MKTNVIDQATIQGIRKLQKPGRPDLLKELISLFIKSNDENMKVLRASVENEDFGTVVHIAHTIKSSAANLGALKLSQCCFELEKIGNGSHRPERLSSTLSQTEQAYLEAKEHLKNY